MLFVDIDILIDKFHNKNFLIILLGYRKQQGNTPTNKRISKLHKSFLQIIKGI